MGGNLMITMFDVAVVGAGPAGATAALTLARRGLKVALLEKDALPRYKTCGGALVARGLALLPPEIQTVVERRCGEADLHLLDANQRYRATRDPIGPPIMAMTMRDRLDHVLASAAATAGAALRAPCTVSRVSLEPRHVRVDTDAGPVTAAFVIAADGATGELARLAGWGDGRHLIPALEYEVHVDDATLDRFARVPRFDVGVVPHGYAWVFPKTTHLSVGVLTTHRGAINLHRQLEEYLRVIGLAPRAMERHGFVIPVRPRAGPFARGRMLLVGDAAGLADPVTAEGISLAARSGGFAADAIIASQLDPPRVRAGYDAALRPMLAELRVARTLARLLYEHPRVRRWMFRRVGQRLVEAITDVFMGARTYRGSVVGLVAALALRPSTRS
jgi:geranylgeranyl reductase family protein